MANKRRHRSTRKTGRKRRKKSFLARLKTGGLSRRQRDLLGLGTLCLGSFVAALIYFDVAGGSAGAALEGGLFYLLGTLAHAVPVLLVLLGLKLLFRFQLKTSNQFKGGMGCLLAAVVLALAAGTFGLGGEGDRSSWWEADLFKQRSGIIGEAVFWGLATLVQRTGVHILVVFLTLAGALLISGTSVSSLLEKAKSLGRGAVRYWSALGSGLSAGNPKQKDAKGANADGPVEPESLPALPPEPEDGELVVRSTHVEAPPVGMEEDFGEGFENQIEDPFDQLPENEPSTAELAELDAGLETEDNSEQIELSAEDLTPMGRIRESAIDMADFPWRSPKASLLKRSAVDDTGADENDQRKAAGQLVEALGHFGVEAKVVGMVSGPHITRYELRLAPGIKVGKVSQLKDDLAYALAATDIRILAPIPGKQAVGVEVPNANRKLVQLGDVFRAPPKDWSPLTVWLGKDVSGKGIGVDLAKMPHMLVAGTTGAGKSGCINAMLSSVLLRATPRDLRLVLVDPKQVELNHYEGIPHLLTPVITNPRKAANALQNLVREMETRYGMMSLARARKLTELNGMREEKGQPPLPYILCVIDELADLMMVAPADVEDSIIRLAQKARAVGIHLVLATQSPRVDVITGMIKANVPSRIAFAVSSQTDSRVILDQNGAESLLGQGDMLFSPVGSSRLQRIQGAYIDEGQIAQVTEWWRKQGEPEFHSELLNEVESEDGGLDSGDGTLDPDEDPLLDEAIEMVVQLGSASTSLLQRRLRVGYTRAGRLIDMLERRGVISGYEGSKPRQVLVSEGDLPRLLGGAKQMQSEVS